ncbi:MAG: SLC13 family permease [Anaerolineae bacterium]
MTLSQVLVVVVLFVPLVFVFLNRLREDIAALLMAVLLGLAQYLGLGVLGPANTPSDARNALTGFGTPEVMTLLALFILTACLDKYGVTRWIAGRLLKLGGSSERRLIGLFALSAAVLSLFMNNLAAGALLLPSGLEAARRTKVKPSKLLIPIAYGTLLGGSATYLTTANIIVSGLLPLAHPPQPALGFFDFIPTGGVVAIAGLLFLFLFGGYLLPNREPLAVEVAHDSDELVKTYQIQERLWEAEVTERSSIANKTLGETKIGETLGLAVLGVRRANRVLPVAGSYTLHSGDTLLIVGREERAIQLQQAGLIVRQTLKSPTIQPNETVMAEIIIPPRSALEGKNLREIAFRAQVGFTAVALWRNQRSYRTDVALMNLIPGDTLLLLGPQGRLSDLKKMRDLIVVQTAANGSPLNGRKVALTLGISLTALLLTFVGMPVEIAMMGAALLILLTGLMKPEEAYAAVRWRAIFLISGTIAVSVAMVQTGLAALVGDVVVQLIAPFGPMGLVAGAYILCAGLTQVMGGQIAPLVIAPITISAAISLGVNPQAIAVVTGIAASASFITPISHPVNILMIAPANYNFRDFLKSGWLLTVVCFVTLMIAVPLFWRL